MKTAHIQTSANFCTLLCLFKCVIAIVEYNYVISQKLFYCTNFNERQIFVINCWFELFSHDTLPDWCE